MKNKAIIVTGITLLVLLSVAVGVYRASLQRSSLNSLKSNLNQSGLDLQEVLARVEKANTSQAPVDWMVYKLKNLNLTLKYPPNLLFNNKPDGVEIYYDTPSNREFIAGGDREQPPGMYIYARTQQASDAYIAKTYSGLSSQWPHATTSLFGREAIVFTGQGMDRWDLILFVHNNILYEVTIARGAPGDEMRSNYYRILSSFSFGE